MPVIPRKPYQLTLTKLHKRHNGQKTHPRDQIESTRRSVIIVNEGSWPTFFTKQFLLSLTFLELPPGHASRYFMAEQKKDQPLRFLDLNLVHSISLSPSGSEIDLGRSVVAVFHILLSHGPMTGLDLITDSGLMVLINSSCWFVETIKSLYLKFLLRYQSLMNFLFHLVNVLKLVRLLSLSTQILHKTTCRTHTISTLAKLSAARTLDNMPEVQVSKHNLRIK
ncbi:hypothetical protein VNO77_30856 [Canavalia gladiata]|uniref:Uncharacterized protein n=1 Tax=Canavalia gladiata TaxID=3824 RepID=A0AAN9Q1J6_CANGL